MAALFAYISNSGDDTVSVIDVANNAVMDAVSVGSLPRPFGNFISPASGPKVPAAVSVVSEWALALLATLLATIVWWRRRVHLA